MCEPIGHTLVRTRPILAVLSSRRDVSDQRMKFVAVFKQFSAQSRYEIVNAKIRVKVVLSRIR